LVKELRNGWKPLVVIVDQFLRRRNRQTLNSPGQSVCADAIYDAEVDDFSLGTLIARDLIKRHAEDFGGDGAMNILVGGERFQKSRLAREMCEDAQLNLAVIRG
jgi:hypothetical protein